MDGSHHDWLESRGPWLVFMGYKDDATGEVFGRFYSYEGTYPALDGLKRYIKKYGIPQSIYLDKHTTYKSWAKASVEEELSNSRPMTQFGRACQELGIRLIHADSPQAKGRVERQFETLQDRLVKELRLANAKTVEEANEVLKKFLPMYNKRFNVVAASQEDLHRPVPKGLKLDRILCIKEQRVLRNDFTIAYDNRLCQIEDKLKTKQVMVEETMQGVLHITHDGKDVKFHEIKNRPQKVTVAKLPGLKARQLAKPKLDHPWKKIFLYEQARKALKQRYQVQLQT